MFRLCLQNNIFRSIASSFETDHVSDAKSREGGLDKKESIGELSVSHPQIYRAVELSED